MQQKSTSLQPWLVGLCVFGGKDPESDLFIPDKDSAFEVGFSRKACRSAWHKVGAAPLTRKCLMDKKVQRKLDDSDNEMRSLMEGLQEANDVSTTLLTQHGYEGKYLSVAVKRVPKKQPVTIPHTKERYLALAKAKTHGHKFTATGGSHMTSDDFFKAMMVPERERERDCCLGKGQGTQSHDAEIAEGVSASHAIAEDSR